MKLASLFTVAVAFTLFATNAHVQIQPQMLDKLQLASSAAFLAAAGSGALKQLEASGFVPYIPTAQFFVTTTYRSNLSGAIVAR